MGEHHNNKGLNREQGTTLLRAGIARGAALHEADCDAPLIARGTCHTQGAGRCVIKKKWKIYKPGQRTVMKERFSITACVNFGFHATTVTKNPDITR